MNMRRAILTGATGAIGLALIRELIDDGVEVLVLCHKGSKRIDRIPVSPLVELKDCSLDDLAGLTNDTGKEYDVSFLKCLIGFILGKKIRKCTYGKRS